MEFIILFSNKEQGGWHPNVIIPFSLSVSHPPHKDMITQTKPPPIKPRVPSVMLDYHTQGECLKKKIGAKQGEREACTACIYIQWRHHMSRVGRKVWMDGALADDLQKLGLAAVKMADGIIKSMDVRKSSRHGR